MLSEDARFKMETGSADQCSEAERTEYVRECEATVARLGKFEGCPRYAPHFWAASMHDGGADQVAVEASDKLLFPELRRRRVIRVEEDGQGFAYVS
jgi:hypothetical protein